MEDKQTENIEKPKKDLSGFGMARDCLVPFVRDKKDRTFSYFKGLPSVQMLNNK